MPDINYTTVALDAMGGDNAPDALIDGALLGLERSPKLKIKLVGDSQILESKLAGRTYDKTRLEIVHASEVIDTGEAPVAAIRHKKDSSIVVGEKLVKEGAADAFVSAGSTGAVLVGGQLIVGRIRGIDRTPIGAIIPTTEGVSLLIDSGANVDARSGHLVQFAVMGSIYLEAMTGVKNPRVAIVNIGAEEEKGNALVKETFPLLQECKDINFTGNIEARDIPYGKADVIVCDAFVGNVILKLYEGTGGALTSMIKQGMMSSLRAKIGALLVKPALKQTLKRLDASEYGGAPMLGLKGLVLKTHGSATAKEVSNTLIQCITLNEEHVVDKISASLKTERNAEKEDKEV